MAERVVHHPSSTTKTLNESFVERIEIDNNLVKFVTNLDLKSGIYEKIYDSRINMFGEESAGFKVKIKLIKSYATYTLLIKDMTDLVTPQIFCIILGPCSEVTDADSFRELILKKI